MGGKGKSTGDTTKADKKEKGSILEEDGKTTTAKPAAKDAKEAKEGDDAGKGTSTGDKKADKKEADSSKGSVLEEDDTTTAKEGDDAGKGKGTGDKKSILGKLNNAIKKKVEEKKADADSSKGSLLEEDDKTTTAKPAAKDAKEGDDAGKGKGTGDKKSILGKLNNAIKKKVEEKKADADSSKGSLL